MTFSKILIKIFGSRNDRLLKRYVRAVAQINALEQTVQKMTDDQLRQRTADLRQGIKSGTLRASDVLSEAFAIMRESMDRNIGIRAIFNPEEHFDPDTLDDDMLETYDAVQRRMIETGEDWTRVSIPPELYSAVRKLYPESRPPFRARCFDVQLIGGLVLYEGRIAEMATGEGKTFVAPLACFMKVLEGLHCHVVTVNDYLVRRDARWVGPAFENLGVSVGFIQGDMDPGGEGRKNAYQCDVTYGINSEFGFDYLRDNMKERADLQVQGPLDFAIVDEVDSILIDEARTPLIISGGAHDNAARYRAADAVARYIIEMNKPWDAVEKACDTAKREIKAAEGDEDKVRGDKKALEQARGRHAAAERALAQAEKKKEGLTQYYEVEYDRKSVHLTHQGIAAAQEKAGVGSFYVGANMEWPHLMEQALRAHVVYERDKDYVVERGPKGEMEVVIVDEYTGRKMVGRQWSDGLHQAAEAKERVPIKQETQTLATITLQNFFKLYKGLAGMTGTAQTEAEEFAKIYRLDVVTIPTNRPRVRDDSEDRVYRTEREKWEAIIDEIKEVSDAGRPVLVGTTSVEKSEMLSTMLTRKYGVQHEVLNAKQHEREASIVVQAGQSHADHHGQTVGNVTIATNMAGRGTDIKLTPQTTGAGGLHVIGTERHTARRIDNQLRGRGGRQGDPGSSRFYVSLQDELMKMFAGEWTIKVLGWLGMEEGQAIEDKRISKGILRAQKKVEERNFLARKNLLDYDEVMDQQRLTFYGMRQQVLEGREIDRVIWGMIGDAIADAVDKFITQDFLAATVAEWARVNLQVGVNPNDLRGRRTIGELDSFLKEQAEAEVHTTITSTLGEYASDDEDDIKGWDLKGLSSWAMSRFHVSLSQNQLRKMTADEIDERLRAAAIEQLANMDCSPLMKFLEPLHAERELCAWAKAKFFIDVSPEELQESADSRERKSAAEIVELIDRRARDAYARREIEYPVEHAIMFAFGGFDAGTDNVYSIDFLKAWIKHKYAAEMSADEIRALPIDRLRDHLIAMQEDYLRPGGKMEAEVDALIAAHRSPDDLARALGERTGLRLKASDLDPSQAPAGESSPKTMRDIVLARFREFLRAELTQLEQFVLIQIFDQAWKDHLYAMDMLKGSVGLAGFAERDPRIVYKTEGFGYFQEMMRGVRDKVTDLIFRARVQGEVQARSAYNVTAATHEGVDSYGVGETIAAGAGTQSEMSEAAGRSQGEAAKVKPIIRDAPKVGRNDLCPCGSGKKYKKCCGANAA